MTRMILAIKLTQLCNPTAKSWRGPLTRPQKNICDLKNSSNRGPSIATVPIPCIERL